MSRTGLFIGLGALAALSIAVINFKDFKSPTTQVADKVLKANDSQRLTSDELNSQEFRQWHEFTSPTNAFKVQFPTLPQHANEKLTDPKTQEERVYDMFVSEKENGTIFMISVITVLENSGSKLDESLLSKVMNDMLAASPNSKLKKMELGKYAENKSLDFSIENDQVVIDGKGFIVGNTLYVLTSVAKVGNYYKPAFDYFVNSFHLLKPTTATPASALPATNDKVILKSLEKTTPKN